MAEKKKWSIITGDQMVAYIAASKSIIRFAREREIHPFAAALAGVAMIRMAIDCMGGDPKWWANAITAPPEEFLDSFTRPQNEVE